MISKRILLNLLTGFLIFILFYPASAQWRKVNKFKRVEVPFNTKHKDLVMEKDKYDFEVWNNRSLGIFLLKIIKKGKTLCTLPGKILRDKLPGARGQEMEEVPDEDTLKMKRIPAKNIVHIIFERGRLEELYPGYVIRFELGYDSHNQY